MHNASRGSLVSLSLSMLLASLGTSIANVSLPSLARAFDASFHAVQWVVLAYLLAITAVIVNAGRLGTAWAVDGYCSRGCCCSPWRADCAAWRPRCKGW